MFQTLRALQIVHPASSQCITGEFFYSNCIESLTFFGFAALTKPTPQNGIQFGGFEEEQELEHSEAPQLDPRFKSSTPVNEDALDDMLTPLSMISVSKKLISNAPCIAPVLSSSDEENTSDKHRLPLVEINDVKVKHTFRKRSPVHGVDTNISEAPAANTSNAKSKLEVDESQVTCEPCQWMPIYEGDSDVPAINFAKRKSSSTLKGNKLSKDEMEPDDGLDEDYEDNEELMHLPDKATSSHKESDDSLDDRKLTSRPMKAKLSLTKALPPPLQDRSTRNNRGVVGSSTRNKPTLNHSSRNAQLSSDDEDDLSKAPRGRCIKFTKSDIPAGSHRKFDSHIVPMWIDFISCLDNIWDVSDYADEMQDIWDRCRNNNTERNKEMLLTVSKKL
ncbi:uncharacterized protein F5891DRAFT_1186850 [Suillus fuscotomentosus]|uniref:Uncharacterized protein n=1 Tax=Suillus fuscotomentosus TaxID=1912939 RepID=A0AAD4EAA0_9AGAM|nr:uncharacterized protein F5891DRAFT_1186850 [Suillus fuscotomentosus]KAG1902267.1 hypothetical protein F5891DRAFT_1186850 [Suillus fuscotomentosus]